MKPDISTLHKQDILILQRHMNVTRIDYGTLRCYLPAYLGCRDVHF